MAIVSITACPECPIYWHVQYLRCYLQCSIDMIKQALGRPTAVTNIVMASQWTVPVSRIVPHFLTRHGFVDVQSVTYEALAFEHGDVETAAWEWTKHPRINFSVCSQKVDIT